MIERNPIAACELMMGRNTGRTYKLIDSLPDDGKAAVLLWRNSSRKRFLDQLRRWRPGYPWDRLLVTSDPEVLRGVMIPVYVDNAVLDARAMDFVRSIQPKRQPPDERAQDVGQTGLLDMVYGIEEIDG